MSKITNDGLTRSGTGCFIAVPIQQQWASKGYATTTSVCLSVECEVFQNMEIKMAEFRVSSVNF